MSNYNPPFLQQYRAQNMNNRADPAPQPEPEGESLDAIKKKLEAAEAELATKKQECEKFFKDLQASRQEARSAVTIGLSWKKRANEKEAEYNKLKLHRDSELEAHRPTQSQRFLATPEQHPGVIQSLHSAELENAKKALTATQAQLQTLQEAYKILEEAKGFSKGQLGSDHSACTERYERLMKQFEASKMAFIDLTREKLKLGEQTVELQRRSMATPDGAVQHYAKELANAKGVIQDLNKEIEKRNPSYYAALNTSMTTAPNGGHGEGHVTLAVLEAEKLRVQKEITARCEEMTKRNSKLANDILAQANEEREKAMKEAEDAKIKIAELEKENEALKQDPGNANVKIAELEKENGILAQDAEDAKFEAAVLKQEAEGAKIKNEELEKENVALKQEIQGLREKDRQREKAEQPYRAQPLAESSESPSIKKRRADDANL